VGFRPLLYRELLADPSPPGVDYVEAISENFFRPSGPPRRNLDKAKTRFPVVLHGVGLNLLGAGPLDEKYLDRLCRLVEAVDPPFVSDHLCWSGAHGAVHHDLLPTPFTSDLVSYAAERAARVQERLGRPFGLENLSSYVSFRASTMTEWEFYTAVVREAGCWFMFDVNNVYVSSQNHGFDPLDYLRAIDYSRVLQVHMAGHERLPEGLIIDTHDRAAPDAVLALYREAWEMGGPFPTLFEWDASIPPLSVVLREIERIREVRR